MKVIRVSHDDFSLWKDQIGILLNCSVQKNFPDAEVDESYGKNKCDEVDHYLIDGSAIVFAAVEGETLAGWVWCHKINRPEGLRIHIAEIAVADKWYRQGIGSLLLEKVEDYAIENGYRVIDLLVTAGNTSAVNFYKKANYKPERFLMKKKLEKQDGHGRV